VRERRKVPKLTGNVFYNQQGLVVAMEDSGGLVRRGGRWGPMMTEGVLSLIDDNTFEGGGDE